MKKLSFIIGASFILSACSGSFSNGEDFYLKSRNGPILQIPSPLTSVNISNFYELPQQNEDPRVSIVPPRD